MNDYEPIEITKHDALALLEKAVAERGEQFRYSDLFDARSCAYFIAPSAELEKAKSLQTSWLYEPEVVPACIVGVGLTAVVGDQERLEDLSAALPGLAGFLFPDDSGEYSRFDEYSFATEELFDETEAELAGVQIEATEAATRVLWAAQVRQDNGDTWGEALAFARRVADLCDGE